MLDGEGGAAQGGDDFAGDPLPQAAVFRVAVAGQEIEEAGFADQPGVLLAIVGLQPLPALQVGVEAMYGEVLRRAAHQAAQVAGGEPGLVFQHQGPERALVADKYSCIASFLIHRGSSPNKVKVPAALRRQSKGGRPRGVDGPAFGRTGRPIQ